jgi:plastocyanin
MGVGVTALVLAGAAACSSTSPGNQPATSSTSGSAATGAGGASSAAAAAITISNFAFSGPVTVAPGAVVTVSNKDSVEHTVTADSAGGFDVSVPPGGTATFTAPTAPGSFPFHCSVHPSMRHGSLIVK